MTKLTDDQVRHIAKLARLRLTDEEVKKFAPELTAIFTYIEKLKEADTENVEPTAQVAHAPSGKETGSPNRFRDDVIRNDNPTTDEMLSTTPLPIVDRQILTPSAHGER
ncbi:MAG: Asp-tRNA(Asn)/Glu-tRNA(Gln) amidotransferase subunit GatC [Candidatus Peribacteraceae bacterium]|jgi:aspartyl-tRNA(Asn)/glutamyl-tRNA(Gln) amidotransferase subunit C